MKRRPRKQEHVGPAGSLSGVRERGRGGCPELCQTLYNFFPSEHSSAWAATRKRCPLCVFRGGCLVGQADVAAKLIREAVTTRLPQVVLTTRPSASASWRVTLEPRRLLKGSSVLQLLGQTTFFCQVATLEIGGKQGHGSGLPAVWCCHHKATTCVSVILMLVNASPLVIKSLMLVLRVRVC